MAHNFYNENAPMPFRGVVEEETEAPVRKKRRALFSGGLLGPLSYSGGLTGPMGGPEGPMVPFIAGPMEEYYEEDEDPNP